MIKARAIQNSDLKVTKGWHDSHGRLRVHVALKNVGSICRTYWILPADLEKPETLQQIKSDLQGKLSATLKKIAPYLERQ